MNIVTIGTATQDIFLEFPSMSVALPAEQADQRYIALPEGRKIELDAIEYATGGGATNAAAAFKLLNFDVTAFFRLGNDLQGDYILTQLKVLNIDTSHAIIDQTSKTAVSIIMPTASGNRTILVYRGANNKLREEEIPWAAFKSAQQLYITSLGSYAASLITPISVFAQQHRLALAVNPGASQLQADSPALFNALSAIEIMIMNSYEAQLFMQHSKIKSSGFSDILATPGNVALPALLAPSHRSTFDLAQFCKKLLAQGTKIVVITNGSEGVYVATDEALLFHPALKVNVVSSVGAGDAFGSTFVATIRHGWSVADALRAGIINAACVIATIGAKTGLLGYQELESRVHHLDKTLLKTFFWEG